MSFLSRSLWATLKHLSSLHGARRQPVNNVTQLLPCLPCEGCSPYSLRRKGKRGLSAGVLPALVSHGGILTYRLCDPGQVPNLSELQPLLRQAPALLGVGDGRDCLSTHSVADSEGEWPTRALWGSGERTVASRPPCQCDRKPGVKVKRRAGNAPGSGEDGTDCISLVKMVRTVGLSETTQVKTPVIS